MQTVNVHGAAIPALGFGVFRMSDAEVERVIPAALEGQIEQADRLHAERQERASGKKHGVDYEADQATIAVLIADDAVGPAAMARKRTKHEIVAKIDFGGERMPRDAVFDRAIGVEAQRLQAVA